jgi:hypothetical protein
VAVGAPEEAFDVFLNRLMRAESNGLGRAKNPRSSALGPFQFINSTFLAVMRQHFADDVARLSVRDILALRTRHDVARRAAKAFSKDNMAYLVERGVTPTFGHLRLAFLLGPEGAARVLTAPPGRPVVHILEGGVIAANPFMRRMTAADLIARATRDVSPRPGEQPAPTIMAESTPPPVAPAPVPATAEPGHADQPVRAADGQAATAAARPEAQPEATAQAEATPETGAGAAEAKDAHVVLTAPHRVGRITARRLDRPAVINVRCDERLASCRRWINQQVARILVAARS